MYASTASTVSMCGKQESGYGMHMERDERWENTQTLKHSKTSNANLQTQKPANPQT